MSLSFVLSPLRPLSAAFCHSPSITPTSCALQSNLSRRSAIQLLPLVLFPALPSLAEDLTTPQFQSLPCPSTQPECRPVEVCDYRLGTGRAVTSGATLTLRWTGRLADRYGWPFQREGEDEIILVLDRDRLIQGFQIGMMGMREGGKRRLLIPGELGYKDERSGPLPRDFGDRRRLFATVLNPRRFKKAGDLVIDVELKKVR